MNRTREDFCRILLDDHPQKALDPETLAGRFVRYFDVPGRPTMEQIKALLKRAGFGEVSGSRHMDAKGIHYSAPGGGYDIHYREDLWEGDAGLLGDPRDLRDHLRDPLRHGLRLSARPEGVHPGRAVRGGGPDAAEGLRAAGPRVGPRRAQVAAGIPLLLRRRSHPADRGAAAPAPHGRRVRDERRARLPKRGRAVRVAGHRRAPDAGLRHSRLPRLRLQGRNPPEGQAHTGRLPSGAGRTLPHGAIRPKRAATPS